MLKMTPAAAQTLKLNDLPQTFAVCVPDEHWDGYELAQMPIERSLYAGQLLADLRDYATGGTGAWAIPDIDRVELQWGMAKAFRDRRGRLIPEAAVLIGWINNEFRKQKPPSIAVSPDGKRLRISIFVPASDYETGVYIQRRFDRSKFIDGSEAHRQAQKRLGWVDYEYEDKAGTGKFIYHTPTWAQ